MAGGGNIGNMSAAAAGAAACAVAAGAAAPAAAVSAAATAAAEIDDAESIGDKCTPFSIDGRTAPEKAKPSANELVSAVNMPISDADRSFVCEISCAACECRVQGGKQHAW